MRKLLVGIGIAFVLFLAAIIIVPLLFKGRIVELIKAEANKRLTAQLDFEDVNLNLISNFPDITLSIDNLNIVNQEPFAGDTLLQLRSFKATIDLMSVITGGSARIESLLLDRPIFNLHVLQDSSANWEISAAAEAPEPQIAETEESDFQLSLRGYEIRDARIVFDDQTTGLQLVVAGLNHQGRGDFTQDLVDLKTSTQIQSLTARLAGISYLDEVETELVFDLTLDMANKKVTLRENRLRLNDLVLNLAGSVAMMEEDAAIDLRFDSPQTEFGSLISLLPQLYRSEVSELQSAGSMAFAGRIDGRYGKNQFPAFDFRLNAKDGMFRHSRMPKAVEQVQLDLRTSNSGGDLDNSVIELTKLHFEIDKQPFDARISVRRPFSNPSTEMAMSGRIDLGDLQELLALEEGTEVDGLIESNLRVSSVGTKDQTEFRGTGRVQFKDLSYTSSEMPGPFSLTRAELSFSPDRVSLDKFDAKIGDSDIQAEGRLDNLLSYLLKDEILTGRLSLTSKRLDLNPWMEGESQALTAVELPDSVEFWMDARFNEVLFDNLEMRNVRGKLHLKNKTLAMQDLYMALLGGGVTVNGDYNTGDPEKPQVDFELAVKQVSIAESFESFVTVQTFAPIAKYMHGNFDARLTLTTQVDQELMPVWQSLASSGRLDIAKANIVDFSPMNNIASALNWDQLHNPALADIHPSFRIENGRFNLSPFSVKVDKYDITVAGSYGIDKSMDYSLNIEMPAGNLRKQSAAALSDLFGRKVDLQSAETVSVLVSIGGTIDNPVINTSMGDMVKSTAAGVVKGIASDLLTKETTKADSAAITTEGQTEGAKQAAQTALEKQKAELEKKKKEAEKKLKEKLKKLIKP
jgi:hypothetical protein